MLRPSLYATLCGRIVRSALNPPPVVLAPPNTNKSVFSFTIQYFRMNDLDIYYSYTTFVVYICMILNVEILI